MPRYFFNLFNDETALDDEGEEFGNDREAIERGVLSARLMAAESVSKGHLTLSHRIEIQNERGETIRTVKFGDVVKVT